MLQGFYQSHQSTAAAVQVNNIHIVRGMLGRPGCGLLQMNGQPTAQNTREAGADGDLPGFRNWSNDAHIEDLARIWNVDPMDIPHYSPPTHAMQMMRYAEEGSIRMLWVSATNPAVSLPELPGSARSWTRTGSSWWSRTSSSRRRPSSPTSSCPRRPGARRPARSPTPTAPCTCRRRRSTRPARPGPTWRSSSTSPTAWGSRTRTAPRSCKWSTPEEAFEAWKECSRGRPCDYTGITYDKLRGGSGIQWPCTEDAPDGTEHIYADGKFWSAPEYCESYGRDLLTGAPLEAGEYKALNPDGKAVIKAAEYLPPHELPSAEYPLQLITGRTVYHFHTRTKTGRAPQLEAAAPEVWVEVSAADAELLGVGRGGPHRDHDAARQGPRPGRASAGSGEGVVFLPFHYGYWDTGAATSRTARRPGRERAHPHGLGRGVEAADLQDRGVRGDEGGGGRRDAGAGADDDGLRAARGRRPTHEGRRRGRRVDEEVRVTTRRQAMKIGLVLEELHRSRTTWPTSCSRSRTGTRSTTRSTTSPVTSRAGPSEHVREIAAIAERYGETLDPEPEGEAGLPAGSSRRAPSSSVAPGAPGCSCSVTCATCT